MGEDVQNLISGFVKLYLNQSGVPEENAVDESGDLKEEYVAMFQELIPSLGEEFWQSYDEDPEGSVNSLIENQQTSDEAVMAKKGAKLKKLKGMKKSKKCACGCDIITTKEKGGKLVNKCACGCKPKLQEGGIMKFQNP